jgi:hypothetical protein
LIGSIEGLIYQHEIGRPERGERNVPRNGHGVLAGEDPGDVGEALRVYPEMNKSSLSPL